MRAFLSHIRAAWLNFIAKSRRRASIKPRRLRSLGGYPPSNGILIARAVFCAAARAHYSRAFTRRLAARILLVRDLLAPPAESHLARYKYPPREILLKLADFNLYSALCVGEAYGSSAAVLVAANLIIDRAVLQALREATALACVAAAKDRLAV